MRSSLESEAGQIVWDNDTEEINPARKLIRVLRKRFGGTEEADKITGLRLNTVDENLANHSELSLRRSEN